ncbi:MAG: hypothetical protein AAGJ87_12425 [Pseudomonadota bacterium]
MRPSDVSAYEALKTQLVAVSPLDLDALHVVIGGALVLLALVAWRRDRRRALTVAFWAAAVAAVIMEIADRNRDLDLIGRWRWDLSLADVARTIIIPAMALAAEKIWRRRRIRNG